MAIRPAAPHRVTVSARTTACGPRALRAGFNVRRTVSDTMDTFQVTKTPNLYASYKYTRDYTTPKRWRCSAEREAGIRLY